jgi:hypothetical protein
MDNKNKRKDGIDYFVIKNDFSKGGDVQAE